MEVAVVEVVWALRRVVEAVWAPCRAVVEAVWAPCRAVVEVSAPCRRLRRQCSAAVRLSRPRIPQQQLVFRRESSPSGGVHLPLLFGRKSEIIILDRSAMTAGA